MPGASKLTAPLVLDTPIHTIRAVELGELTVMWETSHVDHDAGPLFQGLPGDRCPSPHWCVVIAHPATFRQMQRAPITSPSAPQLSCRR